MDIIYTLANNIVNTSYEHIPKEEIEREKLSVLDVLGAIVAGATSPGCEAIVNYVKEMGGREESTLMMHGGRVPAENAALANGTMARALDFEPAGGGPSHSHASSVPTAFAISEKLGRVNGKDFLTAMVLAIDLAYRICNSWNPRLYGWDTTIAVGIFAATSVACKLLRFDENNTVNAFGITLGLIAGSPQPVCDGALAARVHAGLAARGGTFSALIAGKGITGAKNVLEGDYGYFNMYGRGNYNAEVLTANLGKKFHSTETPFKIYLGCGVTNGTTEGVLELTTKYDIDPHNVKEIIISVVKGSQDFTQVMCRPFEIRENPQVDAQYSHRYVAANALLRRSCILEHFTDEYIKDPEVQALVKKVKIERVLDPIPGEHPPVRSEIVMNDGNRYSIQVNDLKGGINRPASEEEIIEKFRSNVAYSQKTSKPLPEKRTKEIIELVQHMEELDDINKIIRLVVAV